MPCKGSPDEPADTCPWAGRMKPDSTVSADVPMIAVPLATAPTVGVLMHATSAPTASAAYRAERTPAPPLRI